MEYDDEGAGAAFGHVAAGLHYLLGCLCAQVFALAAEQPVEPAAAPSAETAEELADFRLEDDNERYGTHVNYRVQQGAEQLHVHGRSHEAYGQQGQDGYEDVHGAGALEPAEHHVYDYCHDNYVEHVHYSQVQKSQQFQRYHSLQRYEIIRDPWQGKRGSLRCPGCSRAAGQAGCRRGRAGCSWAGRSLRSVPGRCRSSPGPGP